MNAESAWDPGRLGLLTLDQLACLTSKDPPGSAPVLDSPGALEAAIAEIDRADREWYER